MHGYDNLVLIGYLIINTMVVYSMLRLLCTGRVNGLIPFIGLLIVMFITSKMLKRFSRRVDVMGINQNDVREMIEDKLARAKVSKDGTLVIKTGVTVGKEKNMFIGERYYNRGLIKFNAVVREVSVEKITNQLVRR